jgi:hypothetical protein
MNIAKAISRLSAALLRDGHGMKTHVATDDLHELLTQFAKSDRIARAAEMHTADGMQRYDVRARFEAFFRAHESADGIESDSRAHAIGPDGKYEWPHKQNMWDAYQAASVPVPAHETTGEPIATARVRALKETKA